MTSHPERLLIGFDWPADDRTASDVMRVVADRFGLLQLYRSSDDREGYAWVRLRDGEGATAETVRQALSAQGLGGVSVRALRSTLQLPGASAGADAPWRYVVETDVVPEHEADFNAPGTTRNMPPGWRRCQAPCMVRATATRRPEHRLAISRSTI